MHDKTRSGTHLLKSSDGGESWNEIYVFKGLYFASLFEDGGAYYVMGLRGGKINVHKKHRRWIHMDCACGFKVGRAV